MSNNKKNQLYLFSQERAEKILDESLQNEKIAAYLIKETDIGTELFAKLCEFYVCNRALSDAVGVIEESNEKRANKETGFYDYIISPIEAKALQSLVYTADSVKIELSHYNLSFMVN
jgi:hypothetical protein